ncbi:MAG: hypothetical protein H0Z28_09720 [Archaeoglobus sp.]|nr:hypothetical protein [Archaeoglobus sp.]
MKAKELEKAKKLILKEWQNTLFGERFRPVVEVRDYLESCTSGIVSGLIKLFAGKEADELERALDDFMRYLATDKSLGPGQAISQLLSLKEVIYNIFPEMSLADYRKLEKVVEGIAVMAFDIYVSLREEIFELRLMEKEKEKRMLERSIELTLEDQQFYDNIKIRR